MPANLIVPVSRAPEDDDSGEIKIENDVHCMGPRIIGGGARSFRITGKMVVIW